MSRRSGNLTMWANIIILYLCIWIHCCQDYKPVFDTHVRTRCIWWSIYLLYIACWKSAALPDTKDKLTHVSYLLIEWELLSFLSKVAVVVNMYECICIVCYVLFYMDGEYIIDAHVYYLNGRPISKTVYVDLWRVCVFGMEMIVFPKFFPLVLPIWMVLECTFSHKTQFQNPACCLYNTRGGIPFKVVCLKMTKRSIRVFGNTALYCNISYYYIPTVVWKIYQTWFI